MARRLAPLFIFALVLGACSRKSEKRDLLLFYGECRVEVQSKTKGAQINLDGINLGNDQVAAQIPCGEKQIVVKKEGYVPYRGYLPVSPQEPLKVVVELEKVKKKANFALSSQLIDQVKKGFKPTDPWGETAHLLAQQEADYLKRVAAAKTAAPKAGATTTTAGAAADTSASAVSDADLNNPEFWK